MGVEVAFEMSIPMVSFIVFACPMLVVEGFAPLCIRSGLIAKTAADHTLARSFTTKPMTIRPPPLHAMHGVQWLFLRRIAGKIIRQANPEQTDSFVTTYLLKN